jgi:hypothetical protein
VIIISIVLSLLVFEASPLNRYMRENEAQELYNQALDFYEKNDFESAIDILDRLSSKYEIGFWGHLYGTEASRNAEITLPNCEFDYACYLREQGKSVEARDQLQHVLFYYPELELGPSSTLQEWTMEYARNNDELNQIELGEGTPKELGGRSEIVIINDSPRELYVYTSDSASPYIMMDANEESSIENFVNPMKGPSNREVNATLNLPSGHLEIAIAAGSLVVYGDLNLESDKSYEIWFYIIRTQY